MNGQRRALHTGKATLQQGLPLQAECGAAGQFWTFTMSNSETQYFHVRRSDPLRRRTSSCTHDISAAAIHARRYFLRRSATVCIRNAGSHARTRQDRQKSLSLLESCWTIRSLLPVRRRAGPPPD